MSRPLQAVAGAAEGLVGAFLGALLFFVVMEGATAWDQSWKVVAWRSAVRDLFAAALVGTVTLAVWIVPVGAIFGAIVKPELARLSRSKALAFSTLIGAGAGLATAEFLSLEVGSIPAVTRENAFWFLVLYCGAWAAIRVGRQSCLTR
jgi:hypothetical protein